MVFDIKCYYQSLAQKSGVLLVLLCFVHALLQSITGYYVPKVVIMGHYCILSALIKHGSIPSPVDKNEKSEKR